MVWKKSRSVLSRMAAWSLGLTEHFGIFDSFVAGSAEIEDLMPCGFEEGNRRLREILVEQELHAKTS
jgi:hypothetical protein